MPFSPTMLDKYHPVQRQALMQHAQFSQQLEQKQEALNAKKTDLDVADRLLKVMDSSVPATARKFLAVQLAQHVGVDPKSEQFRGVQQVLTSLDPDSLLALRQTFTQSVKGAEPGQILEMTKGVMTGQVPFHEIVNMAQASQYQNFGGEKDQSRLPQGQGQKEDAQRQPPTPQSITSYGSNVRSFEGQRTTPPGAERASPQLVGALGLDSTQAYRNDDLVQNGYRIPLDEKTQRELAQSITTRAVGLNTTIRDATQMINIFEGRPETLGPVGSFVQSLQSTIQQVEGVMKLIKPGVEDYTNPNESDSLFGKSPNELADEVAKDLAKAHGLDTTAQDAARIKSMVLGLAYRMAIARDIPGNRLTNAIINQHLVQIGNSSSPDQFKAVLNDTISSLVNEFDETMVRQLGPNGSNVVAQNLDNKGIKMLAENVQSVSPRLAKSLAQEAQYRQEGGERPGIKPSSPTIEEEQQTLGTLEEEEKKSKIEKRAFDREIAIKQEERAARNEERAQDREDRIAAAQEQSNTLARERFEFDKEKFESAQEEKRYTRIANAFKAFGAAISNSYAGARVGVSVPSQPGQDSSAFRLAPTPQRLAPRPPGT